MKAKFDGFQNIGFGYGGTITNVGVGVVVENRVFRHYHKV
jgi:hypothetical protein